MDLKIFCSDNQIGYACWLGEPVYTMQKADIVLMTGGEDVHPSYYNQRQSITTYANRHRDANEMLILNRAVEMNKPIVGVCRGMQLLTIFMGGSIIQDIDHPYSHNVMLNDGNMLRTNSLHHQLCNPLPIRNNRYELLAWANKLSHRMMNGRDQNIINRPYGRLLSEKEPEAILFFNIKALGVQGHPEMLLPGNPYTNFLLKNIERIL